MRVLVVLLTAFAVAACHESPTQPSGSAFSNGDNGLPPPGIVGSRDEPVHTRPVLTVANATVSPASKQIAYRFRVLGPYRISHDDQPVAVSAVVPQGSGGTTTWKVPVDLIAGSQYLWDVQTVDVWTGKGGGVESSQFSVIDNSLHVYTLTVEVPPSCGFILSSRFTFYATSADLLSAAASAFVPAKPGTFRGSLSRAGTALSGTFGGNINMGDGVLTFFGSGGPTTPAYVDGVLNADGGATGSLLGSFMRTSVIIAPQGTCSDSGITWSLTYKD